MSDSKQLLSAYGDHPLEKRGSHQQDLSDKIVATLAGAPELCNCSIGTQARLAREGLAEQAQGDYVSPFYGLVGSENAPNPEVARFSSMVDTLAKDGLLDTKDLESMSLRVVQAKEKIPQAQQEIEALRLEGQKSWAGAKELSTDASYYDSTYHTIVVNEPEGQAFAITDTKEMAAMFAHELGHASKSDAALFQLLAERGNKAEQGSLEHAVLNDTGGVLAAKNKLENAQWRELASEMYADCFDVLALSHLTDKASALELVDKFIATREAGVRDRVEEIMSSVPEKAQGLTSSNPETSYLESHHTTKALEVMRAKLLQGDLAKIDSTSERDAVIGDVVAHAFVQEYAQVRMAEINPYHLEQGKPAPGLPAGLTENEVLKQDLLLQGAPRVGGGTLFAPGSHDAEMMGLAPAQNYNRWLLAPSDTPNGLATLENLREEAKHTLSQNALQTKEAAQNPAREGAASEVLAMSM